MRDQSSIREFCKGVPLRRRRFFVLKCNNVWGREREREREREMGNRWGMEEVTGGRRKEEQEGRRKK